MNNCLHCADVYEASDGLTDLCKDFNYKILLTSFQRLWGYEVTNHKHVVCLTMFKAKMLQRKVYWTKTERSSFFSTTFVWNIFRVGKYLSGFARHEPTNAYCRVRYYWVILTTNSVKLPSAKFYENPSRVSWAVTCEQTDGRTTAWYRLIFATCHRECPLNGSYYMCVQGKTVRVLNIIT